MDYTELTRWESGLGVGDRVTVYWGYGLGFRAHGLGEIVKISRRSYSVRLLEPVNSPYTEGLGWEAGFVLTQIPNRLNLASMVRENGVEPS